MVAPEVEKPDLTIDLRTPQTPETNEIFFDSVASEAIRKVMIIGVAARHGEVDALRMHWGERFYVDGQPLQKVALEALRDAAIAGIDRLDGDNGVHTPAHSVYDQLFVRSRDKTHADFVERLSWMSQNTWKLFNFREFELTTEQEQQFIANERRLMLAADQLFHDLFFVVAKSNDLPDKYVDLIDQVLGDDVASLYLDKRYIIGMLKFVKTPHTVLKNPLDEVHFYEWMLQQEQRLRIRQVGKFATANLSR